MFVSNNHDRVMSEFTTFIIDIVSIIKYMYNTTFSSI